MFYNLLIYASCSRGQYVCMVVRYIHFYHKILTVLILYVYFQSD